MKALPEDIVYFFKNQHFTIISTIDENGKPHNSCKGIIKIEPHGKIYLLDLYKARTYENLKRNPHISITAVDEHKFRGYCLKGKAKIVGKNKLKPNIIKAWEEKLTGRITHRIIKNLQGEKGHPKHPEAVFPEPEYMIAMEADEIVDLTSPKKSRM